MPGMVLSTLCALFRLILKEPWEEDTIVIINLQVGNWGFQTLRN